MGRDWITFTEAALVALRGLNPYIDAVDWMLPPWAFFVLWPLAWTPGWVGTLLPWAALVGLAVHARKPWLIAVVGLSFPFIAVSIYGNLDWLGMVALAVPAPLGAILATVKPQAAAFAVVGWLGERRWRWRAMLMVVLPLALVVLAFELLYPRWWLELVRATNPAHNLRSASLFPYSVPFGLVMLWLAWHRKDPLWGVAATLCLAPYFYISSTVVLVYGLAARNWRWGVAANVISWVFVLLVILGVLRVAL